MRRDQGKYNYEGVRRWTMEKRLKMWGQVRARRPCAHVPASLKQTIHGSQTFANNGTRALIAFAAFMQRAICPVVCM